MISEQFITITLIAFGLAMDCFAVSITRGVAAEKNRLKTALLVAASFGFFQGAMPVIGWYAGETFVESIKSFDHWIAFILLAGIGLKMISESRKPEEKVNNELSLALLLTLSVATSIDALAAGLGLAFIDLPVLFSAAAIGIVSFGMSLAGFGIGRKAGESFGPKMEVLGGVILIGIGLRILLEHSV